MEKRASRVTRATAFLLALLLPIAIIAASLEGLEQFRSFAEMRESRNAGKVINGRVVEGGVVDVIERKLEQTDPDVVILGNSLSNTDLDPALLATELGLPSKKVQKFSIPNSIAAHWYAILKNRMYAHGHHPKIVVILSDLQSALALAPRSEASHLNLSVHLSRSEPVIDEKLGGRNFYLDRVRENRGTLKDKAMIAWRNLAVSTLVFRSLRADEKRIEEGLAAAFDETKTNMRLHSNVLPIFNMQQDRDLLPFDPTELPHPKDSFMPEIAKLVARNGGEVFFLRPPMSPLLPEGVGDIVLPETEAEVPEVVSRAHGAQLDLRPLRMDVGHFQNQDHMDPDGQRRFTLVVAQILREESALAEVRREPAQFDFLRSFELHDGRYVPIEPEVSFKSDPPAIPRAERPFTKGRGRVAVFMTETMGFLSDQTTLDMTPYALRCSPVRVLEDGVPLPMPNRSCDEVAKHGNGRTCHALDRVLFTATEDGNPFTNGKSYSLALDPERSCEGSRWLYPRDQMRITMPESERNRLSRGAGILAVRVIDAGAPPSDAPQGGTIGLRLKVNGVVRLTADVPLEAGATGVRLPIEPRLGSAATNIQLEVTNDSGRYVLLRDARLVEAPRGGT